MDGSPGLNSRSLTLPAPKTFVQVTPASNDLKTPELEAAKTML